MDFSIQRTRLFRGYSLAAPYHCFAHSTGYDPAPALFDTVHFRYFDASRITGGLWDSSHVG